MADSGEARTGKSNSVAVVGASTAGLVAAYRLARAGVPVRVYEAKEELAPVSRTLIVTSAFERLLDVDLSPCVVHKVRGFELISRSTSVRLTLHEPDLVVDRVELMLLLARSAAEAGAELILGHRLEEMEEGGRGAVLRLASDGRAVDAECGWVVGADGVSSRVAELIRCASLQKVALLQMQVELPKGYPPGLARVWFDGSSTRFFYWLIPESPRRGVVGLIQESMEEVRRALESFISGEGLEIVGEQEEAWVPIPPVKPIPDGSAGKGRVLLVGDAAGHVKATTVGGVVTGIRGALAAARSVLRGRAYARELFPLWSELMLHCLVRKVLDRFADEDYDRLLGAVANRPAAVLARYNRDELTRMLWRLLLKEPRWAGFALRALIQKGSTDARGRVQPAGRFVQEEPS